MKIGLIDVDSHNFPNLCLMKLSAYHKAKGHTVEWWNAKGRYDLVYKSRVFTDTYSKDTITVTNAEQVIFGGTGYDTKNRLPPEVEHSYPDYSIYPQFFGIAYGFLSRGCPRNCGFCIVSGKEGRKSVKVADLSEFWKWQPEIKIMDANLLACPDHENLIEQLIRSRAWVDFSQGLDFGLDTSDYSFGYVAGWSSGKEMTELKASLETIQTTAKELITEIEGHFTELQQQRQAEQEQGDTFSIYQLKRGDETRDLRFEPYDRLQAAGLTIDRVNYELVYTAPLTKDMTLGDIWERFNIDHPADFKGHSLSVSDIVVLHQNDEDTAHYVDSIGFQQVPEFLQEQQTPVFDKLPPEQQQALSDTVQDTLQMLVDADKRIYGDVTGKTLEAIAAQGYSYKDGQLEKQQPEATPDSLLTGETVRTPRGNFHITDMSREQIEAAGFGFHHASEDGKYLIMGNGTQAYAIAAEQPQRDNPLKHVEDTIEQNDNNFDGLINNTPQTPTVADFEQRAKAGEAISVTDLAKAVKAEKREQPQKKPSILKKLDEYKKQAAQQPKDKQKEHKKDLEV